MRFRLAIVVLAACGSSHGGAVDAHGGGDAAHDSGGGGVDAAPPSGAFHHYVISSLTAPTSQTDDALVRIDDSGNPVHAGGTLVNRLGGLFGELAEGGLGVQPGLTQAVGDGAITELVSLQTPDFVNAAGAGFQLLAGSAGSGSGDYVVAPGSADAPLDGAIVTGTYTGTGGALALEMSLAVGSGGSGNGSSIATLDLADAVVQATGISDTGITAALIGGAVPASEIQAILLPAIAGSLNAEIAADCSVSAGTCEGGLAAASCSGATPAHSLCCTQGAATVLELFDMNADCSINAQEVAANGEIASELAPDVATTGNGVPDALSFGVAATAVGATFTNPGE